MLRDFGADFSEVSPKFEYTPLFAAAAKGIPSPPLT